MAEKLVSKVSGKVSLSNTTKVNIRFVKKNAVVMLPPGSKNKYAIALPAMTTVTVSTEDYEWLKKHKVFKAAVDLKHIIVDNSQMPDREPATTLSRPEPPEILKPKKSRVDASGKEKPVEVEPGLGGLAPEV
jgi:hypothetical protein